MVFMHLRSPPSSLPLLTSSPSSTLWRAAHACLHNTQSTEGAWELSSVCYTSSTYSQNVLFCTCLLQTEHPSCRFLYQLVVCINSSKVADTSGMRRQFRTDEDLPLALVMVALAEGSCSPPNTGHTSGVL